MKLSFIIRSVDLKDFDEWSARWDEYNAFYGRSGSTALSPEIIQKTWERFFDSSEPVHALVAEKDNQLIGLAHYIFHRNTILIEPTCYLQDLFTLNAFRGQGVGRALINAVGERAKQAGSSRVYWSTHETNLTAMNLYNQISERTGFILYHQLL